VSRCYRCRWVPLTALQRVRKTEPDLHLIKQVEQVTTLVLEGPARPLCQDSEHRNQGTIVIIVFRVWQLSARLIFRCKKQPKQPGAAKGDLFAKGQSGNATGATRRCADSDRVIAYLAHCAPEQIPRALIEGEIADISERARALRALIGVSLLRPHPLADGTPAWTMHPLVQEVGRARAQRNGHARPAVERLIRPTSIRMKLDAKSSRTGQAGFSRSADEQYWSSRLTAEHITSKRIRRGRLIWPRSPGGIRKTNSPRYGDRLPKRKPVPA
jgi:hypothetical protein